ncbi:MAG: methyltransferase domain-containing protein [Desulfomonilaceae bacterium]|nr:methyltransferase domain-containing protein [Desulfomonilaceae bacterium]
MHQGHSCPHCGSDMDPIRTPLDSSWGGEIHHICFNDDCCYFLESWKALENQRIEKTGYRCRMDPRGGCGPAPVWSESALRDMVLKEDTEEPGSADCFGVQAFGRDDETPDRDFYTKPRFVDHLDACALETVEQLYRRLIPAGATILDLMAGPESHLGKVADAAEIVGLGLNREELTANKALSEYVIHDINVDPVLPFPDNRFDVVVNTVSVDYLTQPLEVFREAARVLKPDGIFITVFSNRMFPPKAVNIWKRGTEKQRVELIRKFFSLSGRLAIQGYYESVGKPRPKDDKYYDLGIPGDPIYAVWGKPTGK